ncbi:PREDICTED: protein TPX2-like [Nelumbo nucifera]|uniref:TPX2 C-terminal domain-containing protein n=2 Tax=Nelumbo nucifera TaxID=4432 RepID=A0A822YJT2_NELNU|nr:PREDICTED: protein TPX2-like [Nelumbo nucifera]DAD32373.1 TPA_asm: hypothetical protein HUJ06_011224 [Nelumbo nucifera]
MYSTARSTVRCTRPQQSARLHSEPKGQLYDDRSFDKEKPSNKTPLKEQSKPSDFKLHTETRAAKRAEFNFFVACKMTKLEIQKQLEERVQKIIEEEEIRMLRKEMIPKAQLMPYFDRPFFPQRSRRPPTIPREPSFHMLNSKSWKCLSSCS